MDSVLNLKIRKSRDQCNSFRGNRIGHRISLLEKG